MACRLIINADDFGWSPGVNEAVAQLADEGIVTSTSLMVAAPAAAEAVDLARRRPELAVGLHLALVCAPPLLPAEEIPALADGRGRLPDCWQRAAIRFWLSRASRADLRREAEAQFKAFAGLGLPWSHADAHLHLSLHPVVFREMVRLCRQYGVPAVRVPEDELIPGRGILAGMGARWPEALGLRLLCARQRPLLARAGLRTTRRCYGYFHSGRLRGGYLCRLVEEMPDGDYELHCHPDLSTEAGRAEVAALRSKAFRQALANRGVLLVRYRDLTVT